MNDCPLAIVIPAYKGAFFRQALESIARQTDQRFRVYIGDDASPEPIGKIVQDCDISADRLLYHRFEQNLGGTSLVRQWHRCIRLSQEPWVWLFSDDDVAEPDCVAAFYRELKASNAASDLYRFSSRSIDAEGRLLSNDLLHPACESGREFLLARLQDQRVSNAPQLIFSRRAWKRIGGVPEFPLAWASDDAFITLLGIRTPIRAIAGPRVKVRNSGLNISHRRSRSVAANKIRACRQFVEWVIRLLAEQPPQESALEWSNVRNLTKQWFFHQMYAMRYPLGLRACLEIDRFASSIWQSARGYGFIQCWRINGRLVCLRARSTGGRILHLLRTAIVRPLV